MLDQATLCGHFIRKKKSNVRRERIENIKIFFILACLSVYIEKFKLIDGDVDNKNIFGIRYSII